MIIQTIQHRNPLNLGSIFKQAVQDLTKGNGVINSPVMIFKGDFIFGRQGIQAVIFQSWMQQSCKFKCIQHRITQGLHVQIFKLGIDKANVEPSIMSHKNAVSGKLDKFLQHRLNIRCVLDHVIIDVSQLLNVIRDPFMRVDERSVAVNFLTFHHLDCGDFDNVVLSNRQPCSLYVKYYKRCCLQFNRPRFKHNSHIIIDYVCFYTVDHFDSVLLRRLRGIRITLNSTVISNGYCFVAPFCSHFDILINWSYGIHSTHGCMQMEFYPLLGSIILASGRRSNFRQIRRNHNQLWDLHEAIVFNTPASLHPFAISQLAHDLKIFLVLGEHLHLQRVTEISQVVRKERASVTKLFAL
ncbi:hypothetical protein D3C81_1233400 [compost metagenome]